MQDSSQSAVSELRADQRLEPLALLVVEDSQADARLLQEYLRDAIAQGEVIFQLARTLQEARQILARMEFSCLLVDLGLPDAHGIVVIEGLRSVDPDVAMIVLTGSDDDDIAQQAMQLGVQDYVVKGRYDIALLLRRIRFAVQQNRRLAQLEQLHNESFHSASHDEATGLPNRQLFEDHARLALALAERSGVHPSIVFINIEGYAGHVDAYGQPLLDAVVKMTARLLATVVRKTDTVAYWGDGNFAAVLIPTGAHMDPVSAARRFHRKLRELDFEPVRITYSIGVAVFPQHGRSFEELLENSEQAMYRAKRTNSGVLLWEDAGGVISAPTALNKTDLADLLAPVPLELLYQPWVDLRLIRFAGVEVLMSAATETAYRRLPGDQRWLLTQKMIREACLALRSWRDEGLVLPAISVNVDLNSLDQVDLGQVLNEILAETKLSPLNLRLEITSTLFAADRPERIERLAQLHDLRFPIVLDDFVSGVDGLLSLSTIPLDGVKLCHELLKTLPTDRLGSSVRRVVAATIGAAAGSGLDVVASGIDNTAMQQTLRSLGCRYLQGELYCAPLAAEALLQRWRKGP